MTSDLRESYKGTWAKGALQCKYLKRAIMEKYPFLNVTDGLGACDTGEVKHGNEPVGAPDLYVNHNHREICEIEVTGSDKLVPYTVWIGAHKVKYMKSLKIPDKYGLFLFYGKNNSVRYFLSATEILSLIGNEPQEKQIRGLTEYYYEIPSLNFKGEIGFWNWLDWNLELEGVIH